MSKKVLWTTRVDSTDWVEVGVMERSDVEKRLVALRGGGVTVQPLVPGLRWKVNDRLWILLSPAEAREMREHAPGPLSEQR